ncbi:aminotransferase class I/II-fold pyridoxal phosphate-dependent enzyme [Acidovorax sp. SRB_24]|uniref:aminotransferase class I/II-fold pyridoxal phosphate-dependent enzyme n=1 Tax=Acidovorax sp. SRB_24 TaxID=1962700 RepID=UPI001F0FFD15|nr:aminotransferase class I/II-fold pyridoxal phosphate-dependent enzyme [Acidovorax sp. SRB_24]
MADLAQEPDMPGALAPAQPVHGGPDALGAARHDFSTNSNACGPCPQALAAVQQADATRYPDPAYTHLRARLAAFHGVAPARIVLAASASEFIHRVTALAAQRGVRAVALPAHSYGDYAQAAQARGLRLLRPADAGHAAAGLHWACDPSSPLGGADPAWAAWRGARSGASEHAAAGALRVLDCAYAPLRLHTGHGVAGPRAWEVPDTGLATWQFWTPNKALGLTGVRAAYAIAPPGADADVAALHALAPSWLVGAHGVALLDCWADPATQHWLAHCLPVLRDWKARQQALCADLGWAVVTGSQANYFCAQVPAADVQAAVRHLRTHGIQVRDCRSFGLPGTVRLGVLPPASQDALRWAWLAGKGR